MNSTGNNTFLSLDAWFDLLGSTKTLDYLFICLQFQNAYSNSQTHTAHLLTDAIYMVSWYQRYFLTAAS